MGNFQKIRARVQLLVLAAALSSPASAALITQDWQSLGDGLLTVDTSTSLAWLDLTASQLYGLGPGGRSLGSFRFANSEIGPGGRFDGFRFATLAEVNTLFLDAGFPIIIALGTPFFLGPDSPLGGSVGDARTDAVTNFIGLFGQTDCLPTCYGAAGAFGIIGDDAGDPGVKLVAGPWHYFSPGTRDILAYGFVRLDDAGGFGSFLVSSTAAAVASVPEPWTITLFGPGIFALRALRRRITRPQARTASEFCESRGFYSAG